VLFTSKKFLAAALLGLREKQGGVHSKHMMGDFGIKKRYIVKVKDPAHIKKKIHPEELCINRKTGSLHSAHKRFLFHAS
jgi:hypothetical protein